MNLEIKLDCRELIDRMSFAAEQAERAIRNGLMRGARTARRDALKTAAQDMNVSGARARRGQPTVKNPGGGLTATWTPSKSAPNIATTAGATSSRSGGLSASTFALTGGASAALRAAHGFIMSSNGGKFAVNRIRFGKGTHRDWSSLKRVYAENLNAGMYQGDGAPRREWIDSANAHVGAEIAIDVQRVLDGYVSDAGATVD